MINESKITLDEREEPFSEYYVVQSIHGYYSIWPIVKDIPEGWESKGVKGAKSECLNWIEENWSGPTI